MFKDSSGVQLIKSKTVKLEKINEYKGWAELYCN